MALYSVRLECSEGDSDKFYDQRVVRANRRGGGDAFVVQTTYGRRGTTGTSMQSDPHGTLAEAHRAVDATASKKKGKGYKVVSEGGAAAGGAPPTTAASSLSMLDRLKANSAMNAQAKQAAGGAAGSAPPAKKARTADAPAAAKPSTASKAAKAEKKPDDKAAGKAAEKPFSPMLAATYDGSQNVDGWLMSEKLDGIRAVWHPKERELRTRNSKSIYAPPEFLAALPSGIMLDGELWISYGNFDVVSGIVRSGSPGTKSSMASWAGVRFHVYDAPRIAGPFVDRLAAAVAALAGCAHAVAVPHQRVASVAALNAFHTRVVAAGGEGVMLREPKGAYTHSRSKQLLKFKKFLEEEVRWFAVEQRLVSLFSLIASRLGHGDWPRARHRLPFELYGRTDLQVCCGRHHLLMRVRHGRRDAQQAAAHRHNRHDQILRAHERQQAALPHLQGSAH